MATRVYGLDPAHSAAVAAGTKTRTIRAIGKRAHAQPGDTVRLYEGLRTKHCRLVAEGVCVASSPVRLAVSDGVLVHASVRGRRVADLGSFARLDGFADARAMGQFFERLHGPGVFTGVLIEWRLNHEN